MHQGEKPQREACSLGKRTLPSQCDVKARWYRCSILVEQPVTRAHSKSRNSGVVPARWGINTADRGNHWIRAVGQGTMVVEKDKT